MPRSQLGFSCAQHGFFGTAIKLDARYAAAWRRADDEAHVERLHALAAAQLAGGRFAAALATHEKALASAVRAARRRGPRAAVVPPRAASYLALSCGAARKSLTPLAPSRA